MRNLYVQNWKREIYRGTITKNKAFYTYCFLAFSIATLISLYVYIEGSRVITKSDTTNLWIKTPTCQKITEGNFDCTEQEELREVWKEWEEKNKTKTFLKITTAYNSVFWQTDSTPDIAANGQNIMKLFDKGDYTCAGNYTFGTKLYIEDFGICTIRDRMAKKFQDRIDIHMGRDVDKSRKYGKRLVKVTILSP